jgi:hypothetical protein
MAGGVAFGNVANFAYTYPGLASGVCANAANNNSTDVGDDIGGSFPIVLGSTGFSYILMQNSGYVLLENGGKIQLEI